MNLVPDENDKKLAKQYLEGEITYGEMLRCLADMILRQEQDNLCGVTGPEITD